jgi:histidine triad (HIT) family protein
MASVFSKIVSGELPCYKIYETENCLAFLDVFPLCKGHVLVVPKKEVDSIFDIDFKIYSELWVTTKKVAKAIERSITCERVGIAVIGLEVSHAHVHLLPLQSLEDINFSKPKISFSSQEMENISEKIRVAIKK